MGPVLSHVLRLVALVSLIWSVVSVVVAACLSAVLRARRRLEARSRVAERRQTWFEATR